ncbi:TonB-dependent Receptor Plug Domain [Flexibacter flexilis DSM 6793]|uniref:TonB-dependent Receptor Plug Domain n=1 Tax=Flexibacter flexilis DSM 6793 TaxID=927664 RepID=A0A1I1JL11_9BACT|nr:TonB-dependent receptor [Flexibacter flexilis]SFC49257.1 TonB-dependent Receptor Plug Domain [Flexibacter flexilis DSM 6793]
MLIQKLRLLGFGLVAMIMFGQTLSAQNAEVRGFLLDAASEEPILFTNVYLKGTRYGATTDVNGFYSINKIPAGNYVLMATALNYDTVQIPITLKAGEILTKKLRIKEHIKELTAVEVVVNKQKQARQTTINTSVTKVTPREIKILPSVGAEPDLAQYLQTLPGVVSTGDQGGQLYIRGGSPVQNLVLLDGMVIYNPFHSIGLFSVFDTDIIKNADIYTGGFGADYGGRASAVMDVRTNDGNKKRFGGKASLNPFTAKLMLEGPIVKAKDNATEEGGSSSFVLSARTSYLDKSSKALYPYAGDKNEGLPFGFTDIYGKTTFAAGNGSKISLFGFNFTDKSSLGNNADYNWNSSGGGTNFILLPPGTSTLISGNFAYSQYKVKQTGALTRESTVGGFNGGLDFSYFIDRSEMKYGFGVLGNNTTLTGLDTEYNTEMFGYAKYRFVKTRYVIDMGFRVQYYSSLNTISPEPRLGVKYNFTDKIRLKAATGLYSQNLFSAQSDRDVVNLFYGFISSPTTVVDGNGNTINKNLQLARHLIGGVEIDLNENLTVDIEPYIKDFNQYINVNRNKLYTSDPDFIMEKSKARGIDVMVKYDYDRFYFQGAYSYAKVDRTFGNVTYNPNFDRRHNINLLASYTTGRKKDLEFDVRWNFGSGFPFTQTQAYYENQSMPDGINTNIGTSNGNLGIYYGTMADFNKGRLPYYHRLDVSAKKKFEFSKNTNLEVVASITNVYDRKNLFYFDRVSYSRKNQLPILPAIGANFTF